MSEDHVVLFSILFLLNAYTFAELMSTRAKLKEARETLKLVSRH